MSTDRDDTRTAPPALVCLVILGALSLCAGPVAASDEAALELEVSPASVRVGDRVEVVASARGGGESLWGELTVAVEPDGPWAVVEPPVAVPGARPPAWRTVLAPMELGELELPEISVSVRRSDGEAVPVTCAEAQVVAVVSVLPGGEEPAEPAPLRDPIGVRGLPWEWILPVAGALLPLLAGIAWWWRGRGRQSAAGARTALPPLAELEAATADLEDRIGREPAEGICDRLAASLRHYLERRTGEPAEEMTSFELRLLARRRGWPETTQRMMQRVMAVADGVRFGRRPTADEELRRAVGLTVEAARSVEAFLAPTDDGDAAEVG